MALRNRPMIQMDIPTPPGTGDISLTGATASSGGFRAFGSVTNDRFCYRIWDDAGKWEIGYGRPDAGLLKRDYVVDLWSNTAFGVVSPTGFVDFDAAVKIALVDDAFQLVSNLPRSGAYPPTSGNETGALSIGGGASALAYDTASIHGKAFQPGQFCVGIDADGELSAPGAFVRASRDKSRVIEWMCSGDKTGAGALDLGHFDPDSSFMFSTGHPITNGVNRYDGEMVSVRESDGAVKITRLDGVITYDGNVNPVFALENTTIMFDSATSAVAHSMLITGGSNHWEKRIKPRVTGVASETWRTVANFHVLVQTRY